MVDLVTFEDGAFVEQHAEAKPGGSRRADVCAGNKAAGSSS